MQKVSQSFLGLVVGNPASTFILPTDVSYRVAVSKPQPEDNVVPLTHITKIISTREGFRFLTTKDKKFFGINVFVEKNWSGKEVYVKWLFRHPQNRCISIALALAE